MGSVLKADVAGESQEMTSEEMGAKLASLNADALTEAAEKRRKEFQVEVAQRKEEELQARSGAVALPVLENTSRLETILVDSPPLLETKAPPSDPRLASLLTLPQKPTPH